MPGYIKVDGSQRPVASPYVKVSGVWKPAAVGYVKVNGEWKIWHTAEIVDNFNRANSATLGTASNDFTTWDNLVGTWGISNNAAISGSTAGPHLASAPLFKATRDVIVEVDLVNGTGLGAAFWVQDAANWWAAIPGRRTQNNPSFFSCPSGFTLTGDRCIQTVPTVYTATYNPPSSTQVAFCPSPYTDTGSGCSVSLYPEFGVTSTGIGCRGVDGCNAANGTCFISQTCQNAGLGPCNCVVVQETCVCQPFGGSCSGCSGTSTTGYSFTTVSTPGGYFCPQGGTLNGTTCTIQANNPATFNPATTTYPSVVRIYKSVGSTVTSEFQSDIPSDPASIRVETVGANITVRMYAVAQAQGTPYTSRVFTSSNALRATDAGIVKFGNQAANQATQVDNFRAK